MTKHGPRPILFGEKIDPEKLRERINEARQLMHTPEPPIIFPPDMKNVIRKPNFVNPLKDSDAKS